MFNKLLYRHPRVRKAFVLLLLATLLPWYFFAHNPDLAQASTISSGWWDGSPQITQAFGCTNYVEHYGAPYGCNAPSMPYYHSGIDVGLGCNAPIRSPIAGAKVVKIGGDSNDGTDQYTLGSGFGPNYPTILLPDGNEVLLGHVNPLAAGVMIGQPLAKGQVITTVGTHGYSTGCHLHFEVRPAGTPIGTGINGTFLNPSNFMYQSQTLPGGWWINATPNNGSYVAPGGQIMLSAHTEDNNNGGIVRIDLTVYNPAAGESWHVINSPQNIITGGPSSKEVTAFYTLPSLTRDLYLSFDVYSKNGYYQKAPQGIRKVCTNVPCDVSNLSQIQAAYVGGGGQSCTTAPETLSNTNGSLPGNSGWWRSAATVTLSASAPCGDNGLHTFYSVNGGSLNSYSGPITLNQEGVYNISYYSADYLGNSESTRILTVKIDWTPPVTSGTATGPRDTNGLFRNDVTVGLTATDNLSGVESNQYSRDGGATWTILPGNNNTFPISGNGVFRAQYRSQDVAGNIETSNDTGPIIINKYVIFANATGQSLRITDVLDSQITGDIFTNGNTSITYNGGSSLGSTYQTAGTGTNSIHDNINTIFPTIKTGGMVVPMLSYPLSLYQSIASVVFPSDLAMDSVDSTVNGTIYVQGNVIMDDVNLSGPLSVVATGSITDNTVDSSYQTNDPHNGVLLYAGKDVDIESGGNRNLGLIYAPNGTVTVGATDLTLNGSLVGNKVVLDSAGGLNLSYNPAFSNNTFQLPLVAMGLVKPATITATIPTAPSLDRPLNNSVVSGSRLNMFWNSSNGAVGYQMQIAKDQGFTTLVYNLSHFYEGDRINLAGATTYYWRVRPINQAGTGPWSSMWTFKTQ